MSSKRTLFLVEVAIFTAFALLLDIIPFLSFKIWGQGGSISFAMIPVFIVAFRWGMKGGLLSGFLWGILQIALGVADMYFFWQIVIEYGLAFTVLGFAGAVSKPVQQAIKAGNIKKSFVYIMAGVFIGSALRFLCHFYAGIVFFAQWMPEGWSNIWIYSLVYNISYMFPSFILCTIIVFFLFSKQPRTLLRTAV
ncbi:energy-coupled thiamine transporter ThiT [Ornithinibacillus bavariensis]|uniref:Thiamine transporter n=1 Tax=Ornithinibacillus bavariensis TaxID=545502 RepID=A0A919X5L5_9BACI|nr:energy-coupled thiamine transporter ThiT [Ornithinibacillus bavariensis]GIO25966.1 thiamine transporter [Ornithinibacillus bavariensis]HAM80385.1 energy-coupled thiamine transporter ThiT [Ornithinibacillus sp.]